jgi:hypothetical protein
MGNLVIEIAGAEISSGFLRLVLCGSGDRRYRSSSALAARFNVSKKMMD